jgi:signal transduction histidine kinase
MLGLAMTTALSAVIYGSSDWLIPVLAIAVGAALVWREFDTQGAPRLSVLPARPTTLTWVRMVGGATLIVVGLAVIVVARVNFGSLGPALIAVAVTLVGVGLLTVPLWLRLVRALNAARAERIRTAEREEIASHLHDSVLQTLALIQRQADNSGEVARLARSQERELRTWLFGEPAAERAGPLAALRRLVGEVEDQHGVEVTLVAVGDMAAAGLSAEQFTAVLGATREALVNAAKHAGVRQIDLYAEAEPQQLSVFVRDRGVGFDPAEVSADRHGLAKSIRGRVERRGGRVRIRSAPGAGTEVRITMPTAPGEDKAS